MKRLNENSRKFLANGYLQEGVSPEERILAIAKNAEEILKKPGFAEKFYDYMARGFYSLASPVWSNFGLERGLPISCFGSYIADDMWDILYAQAEAGMMSKYGGGTSGYFGALRSRGTPIKNNGAFWDHYWCGKSVKCEERKFCSIFADWTSRYFRIFGYLKWRKSNSETHTLSNCWWSVASGDDWWRPREKGYLGEITSEKGWNGLSLHFFLRYGK